MRKNEFEKAKQYPLNLQRIRQLKGLRSAKRAAKECNMTYNRYLSYESGGAQMYLADAHLICDVLNCSLDELAGRENYAQSGTDENLQELIQIYKNLGGKEQQLLLDVAKRFKISYKDEAEK